MKNKIYPVCTPLVTKEDRAAVVAQIDEGWISSDGPAVVEFEEKFSGLVGVRGGVAVSSGTGALEAAMFAIGLTAGDEVIMPSFTIISCALAVTRFSGVPVLVDIEPSTWNIDVKRVEACITSKTKAILAVHMYGHSCEIAELRRIADKHGVFLIEDASQVHGGTYDQLPLGSFGDLATFSFYANKLITTGEGGMVVGNSVELLERVRSYRNLCFDKERKYIHDDQGANLRMTCMQAALGLSQLSRLDSIVQKKRQIAAWYKQYLSKDSRLRGQQEMQNIKSVYWMFCFILNDSFGANAAQVRELLATQKVGSRAFFTGLHRQPCLEKSIRVATNQIHTENATARGFYLPSGLDLEESDIREIARRVLKSLDQL